MSSLLDTKAMSFPLALPRLPGADAGLHSRLAQRRQQIRGELPGLGPWQLALGGLPQADETWSTLALSVDGTPCLLRLAPPLLALLVARLPLTRAWAELSGEARALLLEWAALPCLEALEDLLEARLRCEAASSQAALDYSLTLRLQLGDEPEQGASLQLCAPVAERLVALLDRHLPALRAPLPGLALPVALVAGWQRLSVGECRDLRPGDVVLLEEAEIDACSLQLAGGWRAPAHHRAADELQLLAGFARQPFDQENTPVSDPQSSSSLDQLPVILQCRVGSLELTLAELQALGPGSVLRLPRPDEGLVELVVNGRVLGRGELVTLGDGVGVRVTRVADL